MMLLVISVGSFAAVEVSSAGASSVGAALVGAALVRDALVRDALVGAALMGELSSCSIRLVSISFGWIEISLP